MIRGNDLELGRDSDTGGQTKYVLELAKSLAKSKFDVYPSAYANGWAAKWYKSKGGGWKKA